MRLLDNSLIPTRLVERSEFRIVQVIPVEQASRFWLLSTLGRLLRWLAPILWSRFWGRLTTEEFGRRLRAYLELMGGLWIKAGQLLSLRRDLFSPVLCAELSKLLDRTTGFPFENARRIIEEDLDGPLGDFFDEFTEQPFAAASIGQTHRAHLRLEDTWVAVKVQRPGVRRQFEQQLAVLRYLGRLIEWSSLMPHLRPKEILAELEHIFKEELDYRMEASNISRMRKTLKKHGIYAPKVFPRLIGPRVLVMEFIQGVLMSDYIEVSRTDPERILTWQASNNVDPKLTGRRLYHSLLRQIFEDNLFHGDLHPGNIILLRNSRIAFIDFGTIGFMETDYQSKYNLFLKSVATMEYSKAVDLIFLLASTLPPVDLQEIKEECIRILRAWEGRTMTRGLPYNEKSVSSMYQQLLMVMNQHKVRSTWLFLKIDRAALTLDASLMHLIPDANFPRLLRSYFRRAGHRQFMKAAAVQVKGQALSGVMSVLSLVPEIVYEYRMFQAPMFRRHAVNYQGSLSKLDKMFSVRFGDMSLLVLVGSTLLLLVCLHQYYPRFIDPLTGAWLIKLGNWFPRLNLYIWLIILFLVFRVYRRLVGLKKKFEEREIRLPEP